MIIDLDTLPLPATDTADAEVYGKLDGLADGAGVTVANILASIAATDATGPALEAREIIASAYGDTLQGTLDAVLAGHAKWAREVDTFTARLRVRSAESDLAAKARSLKIVLRFPLDKPLTQSAAYAADFLPSRPIVKGAADRFWAALESYREAVTNLADLDPTFNATAILRAPLFQVPQPSRRAGKTG